MTGFDVRSTCLDFTLADVLKVFVEFLGPFLGVVSATLWFAAAFSYVTRETAVARKRRAAARKGQEPNLSGVSLDGKDVVETLKLQSQLNGAAALLSGLAILVQTFGGRLV